MKLAACLEHLKRFEEALAAFDRAAGHDPKNALAWNGRGLVLGGLGRVEEAVGAFERALAIDPRSPLPRLNIAELLDRLGRAPEAAKAYQQFLGVASPVVFAAQAQRARGAAPRAPGRGPMRLTPGAEAAWMIAAGEAAAGGHPLIEPAHLLIGVLSLGKLNTGPDGPGGPNAALVREEHGRSRSICPALFSLLFSSSKASSLNSLV